MRHGSSSPSYWRASQWSVTAVQDVPGNHPGTTWSLVVATVVVLVAALIGVVGGENRSPRVVTTKYGELRGTIRTLDSKQLKPVEVFLGVPYATPPTGPTVLVQPGLQAPGPVNEWLTSMAPSVPSTYRSCGGRRGRPPCLALASVTSATWPTSLTHQAEDCLYLNLYVPAQVADTGHGALPVVVFIHGESFEWGAANPYDGSVLAAHGEVIVITLNYRLGPLGFLNTNADPSSRGHVMNHGLMDQIAALHWVQENIGAFGGDPGSVTLVGHGTGAACIHFLMTSAVVVPGLFQRAVLMSGSALSPWATVATPTHYALKYGRALNCTTAELYHSSTPPSNLELDEMVNCLKEKPLEELQAVHISAPQFLPAFGPSVDDIVIKKDYRREMRKRAAEGSREYDLMFGVVPHEAYNFFTNAAIQSGLSLLERDRMFRTMIRNSYDYHLNEVFISAVNEYTDWEQPDPHPTVVRDAALDALSDALYVAPLLTASNNLRTGHKNQFFYVFNHDTTHVNDPLGVISGSVHGSELGLMLGAPLVSELGVFSGNWTRDDHFVSQAALKFLANFAKTGNPNYRDSSEVSTTYRDRITFKDIVWESYDPLYQKYLSISANPQLRHHYRAQQVALWTWLVPRLQRVGRLEFLTLRDPEAEDVDPEVLLDELSVTHHLFSQFDDPNLYSGSVRPLQHMAGHYVLPSTTTTTTTTTTMPSVLTRFLTTPNGQFARPKLPDANTTAHAAPSKPESAGHVAYSTALSVTITIGVSLLILNVLIFAGVYYQRDRSRLGNKHEQQSQQTSQSSSDQQLAGISSNLPHSIGSTPNLTMTKQALAATSFMYQTPDPIVATHIVTHISECPPAFADPPKMKHTDDHCIEIVQPPKPNGSATLIGGAVTSPKGSNLPRPPPPPRLLPTESQPLLPVHVPAPPKGKIPPYEELRL